jgi:hypothetical protein
MLRSAHIVTKTEQDIVVYMRRVGGMVSPKELFQSRLIRGTAVERRAAIWELVDSARVRLTPERLLVLV